MPDLIAGNTSTTYTLAIGASSTLGEIDFLGDKDWWRVNLVLGYQYQVWVEGYSSSNGTLVDPYLAIYNSAGIIQLFNDDYSLSTRDAYLTVIPNATDIFYLSSEEYGNNATGTYKITIWQDQLASTATAATLGVNAISSAEHLGWQGDIADWYSVSLTAGTQYQFDLIGSAADGTLHGLTLADPYLFLRNSAGVALIGNDDSGVGLNARIIYTPSTSGTYYLDAQESGSNDSGIYRLIINSTPTSGALLMGGEQAGTVGFAGDVDRYSVSLLAGVTYGFSLDGSTLVDPYLEIQDSAGANVASDDDGGSGLNSYLTYTPTSSGTYYLVARGSGNDATGSYTALVWELPTYNLNAAQSSVNEGGAVTFTVMTTGVATNTVLTYTLSGEGIEATDVFGAALSGTAIVNASGQATFTVNLTADHANEGAETLTATVQGHSVSVLVSDTSTSLPVLSNAYLLATPYPQTGNDIVDVTTNGYRWYFKDGQSRILNWSVSDSAWRHTTLQSAETQADFTTLFGNISEFIDVGFNFLGYVSGNGVKAGYEVAYDKGSDLNISYSYNGITPSGAVLNDGFFGTSTSKTAFCNFPDLDGPYAYVSYVGAAGDTWLNYNNTSLITTLTYEVGTNGFALLLHEVLHGLGLKHPHGAGGTGRPTYQSLGLSSFDRQWVSVMSYDSVENGGDGAYVGSQPIGPMIFDAIALQYLYGESNLNAGNTTYDLTRYVGNYFNCQWDASGIDILDGGGLSFGIEVDLGTASESNGTNTHHVGYITSTLDSLFIGIQNPSKWTWLWGEYENINGTGYADNITGNDLDNTINGGGGDDVLIGGVGNDVFDWDASLRGGNDTFEGGLGDDAYVLDSQADIIYESPFEGVDTVFVGFDYSLVGTNLENLKTFNNQSTGIRFTGNSWGNDLEGGLGNDALVGNEGDDTLIGGGGNDSIYGGVGSGDTVVFSGLFSQYAITLNGTGSYVVSDSVAGRDGVDSVQSVEWYRFSDRTLTAAQLLAPVATYAMGSPSVGGVNATSVNEGATVNFNVNTTNVAAGSQLSYTLSGVSPADVTGGLLTGTVTVGADGKAVIPVGLVSDNLTEGAETLTATVQGQTASVTVNDTSTTPVPTYSLTASSASVNEGGSVTYTVATTNVAANTVLNYTLSGAGITTADIGGAALSGTATVDSTGHATFTVNLAADQLTEGAETLTATVQGQTASLTVNDTSTTPVATYAMGSPSVGGVNATSVNEGATVNFNVNTTNVAAGTQLSYTLSGVSSADVTGGLLAATVTVGVDGKAVIPVSLVADQLTEGTETLMVTVQGQTASVTVNDISTTPVPTYSLTASAGSANEGSVVTFTVATTNVAVNTVLNYTLSGAGITSADIGGASLTGTTTVAANGSASFTVNLIADQLTEGTETLTATVQGQTASFTVSDTSTAPVAAYVMGSPTVSGVNVTSVNEGVTVNFNVNTTNVASGTSLSYTLSGVSAEDVTGGSLAGTVIVGADGKAVIPVSLVADLLTEGGETLTVTVQGQSASVTVNDTSTTSAPTYSLTASAGSANEGSAVTFTVATTNVAANTVLNYTLSGTGITTADIGGAALSGTTTVASSSTASFTVNLTADQLTEGAETLIATVQGQTASVTVNDTSTTPIVAGRTKYFVLPSSTGANFTDFDLSFGSVTLAGEQVTFVGSSAVDAVFVRPGVTVDFTLSGSGADKIYLGGNYASYTASIAGSVMTLQRGSGATLESVSFIKSTSAASSDSVIFADGTLNSLDLYNNLKTATALPALSTAETSIAPLAPALAGSVLNASIKAFALNAGGDTFAPTHPGVAMTVVGSLGVDTVYVPRGGAVDCTLLGSGQDLIYFTGNWGDYSKAISGSVLTFSRTVDGYNESVKVVGSATNISLNDHLVFADGAVYSGDTKTALTASLSAAITAVTGYDATLVTPGVGTLLMPNALNGVTDLEVGSNIVLNYSANVSAVAGKYIHIVNDGGAGFHGESTVNTLNILVTDTTQVSIVGGKVTLNPTTDLDLANNYHITIDAGAFTTTATGAALAAYDGTSTLHFSTVTPGTTALANAVVSHIMNADGTLGSGHLWLDIEGIGSAVASIALDLSGNNYVLVAKDYSAPGGSTGNDGVTTGDFNVAASNFGAGDLLYIDNQGGAANDLTQTIIINRGTPPSTVQFAGTNLGGFVDISLAGTTTPFETIALMKMLLGASTSPVISA